MNNTIGNLSTRNRKKLISLLNEIDEALEIQQGDLIEIKRFKTQYDEAMGCYLSKEIYVQYRTDALDLLRKYKVIDSYTSNPYRLNKAAFTLKINHDKYVKLKEKIFSPKEIIVKSIDFPQFKSWGDLSIRFLNGHDVEIKINKFKVKSDFNELGFKDQKTRDPNLLWKMLEDLAEKDGSIAWGDHNASGKIKSKKYRLSKRLKEIFDLDSDPFYRYTTDEGYKVKFNLTHS